MENPDEEIITYEYEDKYDDVIDEEEVDCTGVRLSTRESRTIERL